MTHKGKGIQPPFNLLAHDLALALDPPFWLVPL
jgi:hypothetical protein